MQTYLTAVIAAVVVVVVHALLAQGDAKMKLTKSQLKQIIEEELGGALQNPQAVLFEQLEDILADIMNHSSDAGAAKKAEAAYALIEQLRGRA